jgi:hypothetical protein
MPVQRSEYDSSESYWASAGPRNQSCSWPAHRNTPASKTCSKPFPMADIRPIQRPFLRAARVPLRNGHRGVFAMCTAYSTACRSARGGQWCNAFGKRPCAHLKTGHCPFSMTGQRPFVRGRPRWAAQWHTGRHSNRPAPTMCPFTER